MSFICIASLVLAAPSYLEIAEEEVEATQEIVFEDPADSDEDALLMDEDDTNSNK
jgi:hypothetical protein